MTMAFTRKLATVALGALMLTTAQPASAQNLLDVLFGGPVRRANQFPPAPAEPTGSIRRSPTAVPAGQGAPRAKIAKIAAPTYFDYKVDSLPPVDFGPILGAVPAPEPEAMMLPPKSRDTFVDLVGGLRGYELRAERSVASAIQEHYAAKPEFLWIENGKPSERARDAVRLLEGSDKHGLDPADYAVIAPSGGMGADGDLVRFEMALSARLLRYARDAWSGRIDPNRLSGYHDFAEKPLDLKAILVDFSAGREPGNVLEALHPTGPEYRALQAELDRLHAEPDDDIAIDPKLFVRPGGTDAQLPKIVELIEKKADEAFRQEHAPLIAMARGSETYSDAIVPLIKAAQKSHGLNPDGVIGPRTVEALAGITKADRMNKVLVAMEQRRWLPRTLAPRRVFINQPAYMAAYFEDGEERLSMRVVIGKTANQTTFFQDEIEYVEYNPYWGVPQSIIVNEMLPRLRRDPGYLDRAGYEVTDSRGKRISSSAIDWNRYGGRVPYNVRQTPSEANALGELKIMFPNKHAIYMHDTPARNLFERDTRAFSHGCVRLHDPRGMAAAVLGKTREHVADRIARGHNSERLTEKVPVYVAYFTAWPQADGKIAYFADVYGRDDRVKQAMQKTEAVRAGS